MTRPRDLLAPAARLLTSPIFLVVLGATTALAAGLALKSQCTYHDWNDHFAYTHYCYSDIAPLFEIRKLNQDAVPYVQEFSEYPVLTSYFYWAVARVTQGKTQYLTVTFTLLSILGGLATVALWKSGVRWTRTLAWAASPAIVIHGLTNWDLLAVSLFAWGWYRWRAGEPMEAAFWFGLGGSAKLYPGFFLPFLFLHAVLLRDWRMGRDVTVGGFLGFGVPNLATWLLAPQNWLGIWKFHSDRYPDFETPWEALIHEHGKRLFPELTWGEGWREFVELFGAASLLLAFALLAHRQRRAGLDPLVAGGIFTLLFLLVNRVYSPQYTLWVLPILVALEVPWRPLWGFLAADLAVFLLRYPLFTTPVGMPPGSWDQTWAPWHRGAVLMRWFFLVWMTAYAARLTTVPREVRTPAPPPAPVPAPAA